MENKITQELLNIFEALIRAQLNTIRELRRTAGILPEEPPPSKSMSQMNMVYDILLSARRPMHVDDIITEAQKRFNQQLDKESIVSALAKRVKRQDRFIKTAPNTFSLISQDMDVGGASRKGGRHATS